MDIAQFIQEYSYLAIALGSFIEGEAVLIGGSFAASQGHLEIGLVLPIAALASFLGDLPYFFAGRRYGDSLMGRYPSLQRRKGRLEHLLQRHQVLLVLCLRFLYGLRIAGLLTLGMSKMTTLRFLWLDFIGALIWASSVCAAGYGVGRLIKGLAGNIGTAEQVVMFAGVFLCGSALTMVFRRRAFARIARSGW